MPVSAINPDGSVKIYSKTTGQVLDVAPADLPKYNPALVGDYQTMLQKQQTQQKAIDDAAKAVSTGNIKLSDLPTDQRAQIVNKVTASGGKIVEPPTAAELKNKQAIPAITQLINTLEKHYQGANGAESSVPILSNLIGAGKTIAGNLNMNPEAATYNKEKAGFAATLKSLTGDTGVLTDQDYARLSKLLPGLGASPQEAKNLLNDLRSQVSAKFGGNTQQTTINPQGKGLLDTVLGPAVNIAQDVGTGIRNQMEQPNLQKESNIAQDLETRASLEQDPQRKKSMLQQATQLRTGVSNEAGDIGKSFSEDVNKGVIGRSLQGATAIAGAAEIPGGISGVVKGGGNLINILKNPVAYGAAKREAALTAADAAGATFKGDDIVSALTKAGETISPADRPKFDAFVDMTKNLYQGKDLSARQIVDINSAANTAYTSSGNVGKTAKAVFNKELGDILKAGLREKTPDIAAANQLMSKLYGAKKIANNVPSALVGGGIGALGATLATKPFNR